MALRPGIEDDSEHRPGSLPRAPCPAGQHRAAIRCARGLFVVRSWAPMKGYPPASGSANDREGPGKRYRKGCAS